MNFTWRRSPFVIRQIQNPEQKVFLTFDDGPNPNMSSQILEILAKQNIKATFFSVGDKIRQNPDVAKRILHEGHQILSHSSDHGYRSFFSSEKSLKKWVLNSVDDLEQQIGQKAWGFRPPAGILTLPLLKIAEEEKLPLYFWNHRFYDTQREWSEAAAAKSATKMQAGDIVLLHDEQKKKHLPQFLRTLENYIQLIKNKGHVPSAIEPKK